MAKLHDRYLGLVIAAVGVAVIGLALNLPGPIAGAHIPYGPGFFPTLLGAVTTVAGLVLAIFGTRTADGETVREPNNVVDKTERPRLLGPGLVLGSMLAYVYLSDAIGFIPLSLIILLILLMVGGMRPIPALLLSLCAGVAIYLLFSKGLLVPLPRGILQPWAALL